MKPKTTKPPTSRSKNFAARCGWLDESLQQKISVGLFLLNLVKSTTNHHQPCIQLDSFQKYSSLHIAVFDAVAPPPLLQAFDDLIGRFGRGRRPYEEIQSCTNEKCNGYIKKKEYWTKVQQPTASRRNMHLGSFFCTTKSQQGQHPVVVCKNE